MKISVLFFTFISFCWASSCYYPTRDGLDALKLTELKTLIETDLKLAKIDTFMLMMGSSKELLVDLRYGQKNKQTKFDLASITKVFNAMALMNILNEKQISTQTKLYKFFSEFNNKYKKHISIEDLLRHQSGFKPGVGNDVWTSRIDLTWQNILNLKPTLPYTKFKYSDINFLYVGKLIEKLTQLPLDVAINDALLDKLKLSNTTYNPRGDNCYLTSFEANKVCKVHDPTSFGLNGLTGHAGIFSTPGDMITFARMLLNDGYNCNGQLFDKDLLNLMKTKINHSDRGLGFDISSAFARRPRGEYFSLNTSYGHTGFTGVSMWIDPKLDIFVLVLSNAVYSANPNAKKIYLDLLLKVSSFLGKVRSDQVDE